MKKTWKKLWATLLLLLLLLAVGLPVFAAVPGDGAAPDENPPAAEAEAGTEAEAEAEAGTATATDIQPEGEAEAHSRQPDAHSVVVESYAELKKALGEDNGITTVYLGASITAESGAIPIHPGKSSVIIDGSPPTGGRYTYTQHQAGGQNGVFSANSAGAQTTEVTLRNMDVVGKTELGLVQAGSGVVITLENLSYTGPQALYHRGGSVRVIGGSYSLPAGELAEARQVELGGVLTIEGPPNNAVLWLTAGASTLKVLAGADVRINTSNYFIYGSFAGAQLGAGARLSLTSRRFGFSYAGDSVGSFTMAEGAVLEIDLYTTESYAALRVSKRFEMAPGSSAVIKRTGTAGIPLRLTAAGAVAVFNQPQRVLFYSGAGVPLRFTGAGTLSITTCALNVWQSAPWPLPGGMDAQPSQVWNKAGGQLLTLEGSYNETANRGLAHNLTDDDPVLTALDANSFNLEKNQLLALGAAALDIDSPAATAPALTGASTPGAELLAAYILADGRGGKIGGSADATGRYRLPVSGGALQAGSLVSVLARQNDLFMRQQAQVRQAGAERLAFVAVPEQISFGVLPMPGAPVYAQRQQAEFELTVQDTRAVPRPWRIQASLAAPGTAEGDAPLPPNGVIVFTTKDGEVLQLSEAPQTVYRHSDAAAGTITVRWGQSEGVLLNVAPGEIYSNQEYRAAIHWSLVDAP